MAVASRLVVVEVLPGDLAVGDVIAYPGAGGTMVVSTIRLGQGGFVLTVAPVADGAFGEERPITLTAATRLYRQGKVNV
jgi:hypothetical protein